MSAFGVYNMAGNVAEWTSNDSSDGFLATGGAWGDPLYMFARFGGRPGFFSSEKLGFRCVRSAAPSAGDQGGLRIELDQEVPQYTASSPQQFATLARRTATRRVRWTRASSRPSRRPSGRARRSRSTAPMARARWPTSTCRCTRRGRCRSFTILPAGDVDGGFRSLPDSMDDRMAPFVRGGRAAFGVVLEGYIERLRPANFVRPDLSTVEFAEIIIGRVTDLRRSLDYLETRPDIDKTRLAVFAPSAGSVHGLILGALETRYRAFMFVGAGLPGTYRVIHATVNPDQLCPAHRGPQADHPGTLRRRHAGSNRHGTVVQAPLGTEEADPVRRRPRAVDRGRDERDARLAGRAAGTRRLVSDASGRTHCSKLCAVGLARPAAGAGLRMKPFSERRALRCMHTSAALTCRRCARKARSMWNMVQDGWLGRWSG